MSDIFGINKWTRDFKYENIEKQYKNKLYTCGKTDTEPIYNDTIQDLRRAACVHRQVRSLIQPNLKDGMNMLNMLNDIERYTKDTSNKDELNNGIGFPCGISKDNCAAHFSPVTNMYFDKNSIYKIDFGTHSNGFIIDSAFSVTYNPDLVPLMNAVKEATWTGINNLGVDVIIGELGEKIQEVMESYEIEINGKTYPVKSVSNLGGHNIEQYKIHGGELLLGIKNSNPRRIKSDTIYAVETFGTTGNGTTYGKMEENTLYSYNKDHIYTSLKYDVSKKILAHIQKNYTTLPFTERWLMNIKNYKTGLKELTTHGIINSYPPLYDVNNSYSAQYEHTVYVTDKSKEILSFGDDY
jgi:methionyl aminopeptidase